MRSRRLAVSVTALGLLAGCGGEDSMQGPPAVASTLDFSAIAGSWEGTMSSGGTEFPLEVSLSDEAERGFKVGTADYYFSNGDFHCQVELRAERAAPPDYTVREVLVGGTTGCEEGYGVLDHDPDANTLRYEFRTDLETSTNYVAVLTRPAS